MLNLHAALKFKLYKSDLKHLVDRVEMSEEEIQETKLAVHHTQLQGSEHSLLLRDMQCHVKDLDNRGRRDNIRVRGLPEPKSYNLPYRPCLIP